MLSRVRRPWIATENGLDLEGEVARRAPSPDG